MGFDSEVGYAETGRYLGFALSYLIFTAALYLLLSMTGRMPIYWSMLNIAEITLGVTLLGMTLKGLLK